MTFYAYERHRFARYTAPDGQVLLINQVVHRCASQRARTLWINDDPQNRRAIRARDFRVLIAKRCKWRYTTIGSRPCPKCSRASQGSVARMVCSLCNGTGLVAKDETT